MAQASVRVGGARADGEERARGRARGRRRVVTRGDGRRERARCYGNETDVPPPSPLFLCRVPRQAGRGRAHALPRVACECARMCACVSLGPRFEQGAAPPSFPPRLCSPFSIGCECRSGHSPRFSLTRLFGFLPPLARTPPQHTAHTLGAPLAPRASTAPSSRLQARACVRVCRASSAPFSHLAFLRDAAGPPFDPLDTLSPRPTSPAMSSAIQDAIRELREEAYSRVLKCFVNLPHTMVREEREWQRHCPLPLAAAPSTPRRTLFSDPPPLSFSSISSKKKHKDPRVHHHQAAHRAGHRGRAPLRAAQRGRGRQGRALVPVRGEGRKGEGE